MPLVQEISEITGGSGFLPAAEPPAQALSHRRAKRRRFFFPRIRRSVPAAVLAWFAYGVFTSLFDDSVFEQMFETSGIFFGIVMAVLAVGCFYRSIVRKESREEA